MVLLYITLTLRSLDKYLTSLDVNICLLSTLTTHRSIRYRLLRLLRTISLRFLKTAAQYLFKILFGEQVDVYYPREKLVTPSAASWIVDTILSELKSGDPANLPNSNNQFADDVDPNTEMLMY